MNGRLTLFALAAVVLAGCTNPGAAYREDAAHAFKTNLVAETERVLAEAGGALTLSNALGSFSQGVALPFIHIF